MRLQEMQSSLLLANGDAELRQLFASGRTSNTTSSRLVESGFSSPPSTDERRHDTKESLEANSQGHEMHHAVQKSSLKYSVTAGEREVELEITDEAGETVFMRYPTKNAVNAHGPPSQGPGILLDRYS